jgi:hypothetical protein
MGKCGTDHRGIKNWVGSFSWRLLGDLGIQETVFGLKLSNKSLGKAIAVYPNFKVEGI